MILVKNSFTLVRVTSENWQVGNLWIFKGKHSVRFCNRLPPLLPGNFNFEVILWYILKLATSHQRKTEVQQAEKIAVLNRIPTFKKCIQFYTVHNDIFFHARVIIIICLILDAVSSSKCLVHVLTQNGSLNISGHPGPGAAGVSAEDLKIGETCSLL